MLRMLARGRGFLRLRSRFEEGVVGRGRVKMGVRERWMRGMYIRQMG